jgi:hypothetical protein
MGTPRHRNEPGRTELATGTVNQLLEYCTALLNQHPARPGPETLVQVTLGQDYRSQLQNSADGRRAQLHHTPSAQLLLTAPLGAPVGQLHLHWSGAPGPAEIRITRHIPSWERWGLLPADRTERHATLEIFHVLVSDGTTPGQAFEIARHL